MKKIVLVFLLASLNSWTNAQSPAEKIPLITESLAGKNIKTVLAETSGGYITVKGVSDNEARLEVYVTPNNHKQNPLSEQEIRQRMKDLYETRFESANNKLTAIVRSRDRKMDWKMALNFSYVIYVPRNVSIDLSTSGGSINLANLAGDLEFTTSGGSLNLEDVSGNIKGSTSGGSINLENAKENIELSTSGGGINAKNCEGKLVLSTSGGSLSLIDLSGDIRAITSGGGITGRNIEGELITSTSGGSIRLSDLSCSLETSTSAGSINVSVKKIGKYIRIDNSAGNIELELPRDAKLDLDITADRIQADKMAGFEGKMKLDDRSDDDEIIGKLNGGGVPVTVRAGSGRIYLGLK